MDTKGKGQSMTVKEKRERQAKNKNLNNTRSSEGNYEELIRGLRANLPNG